MDFRKDIKDLDLYQATGRTCNIVFSPESTGSNFTLLRVEIDPGVKMPMHTHPDGFELMYYLSGTGEMTVGDEEITVGPDVVVVAKAGVPHQTRVGPNEPLVCLCTYVPPLPDSYITANYKKIEKTK